MRLKPSIQEEDLRACLQEEYDLTIITIEYLPLGLDYNAGVYRAVDKDGTPYLLKAKLGVLYGPGYLMSRYLYDQGITAVVAPRPTKRGAIWANLVVEGVQPENWNVMVYPFIDGDTSFTGMTDEQWRETGSIFRQIHQVKLPSSGFEGLRKETFDPGEYVQWIRDFESQHLHSKGGSVSQQALRSCWLAHQSTIQTMLDSMEKLGADLQRRALPLVICHADLHPANLLRDRSGRVFVIDWDDVKLATKERDFIFVWEPQAEAFFQGYGKTEIDWVALTYYQWERVVTDLIEDARNVCFREDWEEEVRADAARMVQRCLEERGGNIDAAYAAAAHLPSDLQ
jgi:spectinomycin phosphotransferase